MFEIFLSIKELSNSEFSLVSQISSSFSSSSNIGSDSIFSSVLLSGSWLAHETLSKQDLIKIILNKYS